MSFQISPVVTTLRSLPRQRLEDFVQVAASAGVSVALERRQVSEVLAIVINS